MLKDRNKTKTQHGSTLVAGQFLLLTYVAKIFNSKLYVAYKHQLSDFFISY